MTAPRTPEEKLSSRSWRFQHSLWTLSSWATIGFLAWAGFLYVGVKSRNKRLIIASAIWAVLGFALILIVAKTPSSAESPLPGFAMIAFWIGSVIHQMVLNKEWLRWRAYASPWYSAETAVPATPSASVIETQVRDALSAPVSYSSHPPAGPATFIGQGGAPRPPVGSQSVSTAPLDVNRSSAEELVAVIGFTPADARAIVASRDHIGPYRDPQDLVTRGVLPPHVYMNVRDRLTVANAPSLPRVSRPTEGPVQGRRLEF